MYYSSGQSSRTPRAAAPSDHITADLDAVVERFSSGSTASDKVTVSRLQAVASYSWLDETTPSILVPGAPGVWNNLNPTTVPQDAGKTFVDQNSARMGTKLSPLAPIFAALQDLRKMEVLKDIDLVTDRNNLRKLLRWATRSSELEDFRIDVELAGNACLFTRREKKDTAFITGFMGYGHEYEKKATTPAPGCERTTGHHRIVTLNIDKIRVLLRFEVDACTALPSSAVSSSRAAEDEDDDAFTAAFSKLTTDTGFSIPTLKVTRGSSRTVVPQANLIEMKTRVAHKSLNWTDTYPQLYLSQTPFLYLAKHNRGVFQPVERYDLQGPTLKPYADRAEQGMVSLRDVLVRLLKAVRKEGEGVGLSLVCRSGALTLYRRQPNTGRAVGPEIRALFKANERDD